MMDLSSLDTNNPGSWPLQVKAAAIFIVCCLVAGGGYYQFTMDQLVELDVLEAKERELITEFEGKQKKAVNLADYRAQFEEIKKSLKEMLKQMPTKAEVAILLTDISQTAITSGLDSKLFQPEPEVRKEGDFYVELPYSIEMVGTYDELGLFIGGLASLPRIVTVHDVAITKATEASGIVDNKKSEKTKNLLSMKATIKTYTEVAADEKEADK